MFITLKKSFHHLFDAFFSPVLVEMSTFEKSLVTNIQNNVICTLYIMCICQWILLKIIYEMYLCFL